jgi:glucose 1-dehydrogenase
MGRLQDRIAVVTGADSGMGQAMAALFAAEGADVAITFHTDAEGAEETGRRVQAAGRRTHIQQLEVTDERAVERWIEAARSALGPADILVNNAGVGAGGAPVAKTRTEDFDLVLRTNLYGPFFCCRAFLNNRDGARPGGKIINITSVHEAIPSPENAAYGASKGGLLTFTRSLALELAPQKINVNAIAPGLIHTPMTAKRVEDPDKMREQLPNIPWHRPGKPEEVAQLALYLASDESDYVTGQSFTIDGGLEMNWGQGA